MANQTMLRGAQVYFQGVVVHYLTAVLYCLEDQGLIQQIATKDGMDHQGMNYLEVQQVSEIRRLGITQLPKILELGLSTIKPMQ